MVGLNVFSRSRQTRQTDVISYSLGDFIQVAKHSDYYQILKAGHGSAYAQALTAATFEYLKKAYAKNSTGTSLGVTGGLNATLPMTVDGLFRHEFETTLKRRGIVLDLLQRAQSGSLRKELEGKIRNRTEYNGGAPEGGIEEAFNWVTRSWHDEDEAGMQGVLAVLEEYTAGPAAFAALGPDHSHLWKIHRRVVTEPYEKPFRGPNPYAPYPSSMAGALMLKWIFEMTAGVAWPAIGNPAWQDWALFYMGSIVTVQGFVDANKRTGRLAYAIVLLKGMGGTDFKAPTIAFENELYAMNG